MIARKLRVAAAALFLGMAVVAAGGIAVTTPAEAAVRASVGKPLQSALSAAQAGNYAAAMRDVHKAESVKGLTAEEKKVINQTRQYIEVKSGGSTGVSSPASAQAKFDSDYRARRYRAAINDEGLLRKYGVLKPTNMVVIAQAYFQLRDYKGCVRYALNHTSAGQAILERAMLCAYRTGDTDLMRDTAERLVAVSGSAKNWNELLNLADRAKQTSDAQKLDIYRLRYLTGGMTKAGDYMTLAQLLIAGHLPTEAVAVIEKGMQAKILVDARARRLLARAKSDQAKNTATLPAQLAEAKKARNGDELIRIGQEYTGRGQYPEAISTIKAGIAKGPRDPDMGYVALAQAEYAAGKKAEAIRTLSKAKKTANGKMIARLWELYYRHH